jgi:glycosyltransferase involved in cell wall biosynthesis
MRIGVDCFHLGPNIGGMKQYFVNLFRELLTNDSDNTYVFFHYSTNAEELSQLGVDRWRTGSILLKDRQHVRHHLDEIDLYFSPFGVSWPRPLPKPSVVMLPDVQEIQYPQFFAPLDLFNREWHFRASTRLAEAVVTLSGYSKQTLVDHYRLSPAKVFVSHVAVDDRYLRAAEVARMPRRSLPAEFVFYPANRWQHKNHDRVLQALVLLRQRHGLSVDAVFSGYDVANGYPLAEMADRYGIGDLVHDVGFLSVEELAFVYRQARLLVFPSLYEGFGIPLVEAMAAGCPVVASSHTSVPETVSDAAICFDPTSPEAIAQAIKEVWCDADLRRRLIVSGRHRATRFSASDMARIHLHAFQHAIATHSPRRYPLKWLYERYYQARAGSKTRQARLGTRIKTFRDGLAGMA